MNRLSKWAMGIAAALMCAESVHAAGFAIIEQSTKGMGRSLGGITADTRDTNALYFNPSVIGWFDHKEISLGINWLKTRIEFQDRGSSDSLGDEEGNDIGGWSNIPNIYYVHPLTENVKFGIGLTATSGTKTDYHPKWIGRYTATLTDVAVVDINPVIAWRLTDNFSIGAGLAIEYAMVEQEQMLDFR